MISSPASAPRQIAAVVLASLLLGGCLMTGRVSGTATFGHDYSFIDHRGPIFGHPGTFRFVYDRPGRHRIVGNRGNHLGYAIIEFDYRVRITDHLGATLYWYYREPDGYFHFIDASHKHRGFIDSRNRHYPALNRFWRPGQRIMKHDEIERDRRELAKPPPRKKRKKPRGPEPLVL